jgi:hypothetical protein
VEKVAMMKPVTQTKFGHGEGNCFAACIASLLHTSIDDVPNLQGDETWRTYIDRVHEWLSEIGLAYIEVKRGGFETCASDMWGYHLICGDGPRKRETGQIIQHAVVGCAGRILWDPHPSRDGLLPESPTNPYYFGFLMQRFGV